MRLFLGELNHLASKYKDKVKFVFIYILEAHAIDEWPIAGINEILLQHRTLQDRAKAATLFMQTYPLDSSIELLLDNEFNDFNQTYPSWPFRYWVVQNNLIAVKAMPETDSASLKQLYNFLEKL